MSRFLAIRLLRMFIVVGCVAVFAFGMMRFSGDPSVTMLPIDATPEQRESFRRDMGLDQPLIVQFGHFVMALAQGDLGESLRYRRPVINLLISRLPATLELALLSVLFAGPAGILLGVLMVVYRRTIVEMLGVSASVLGLSIPNFWLGIMLIIAFSVTLGWVPTSGRGTWRHLVLPVFTLGAGLLAPIALLVQSGLTETLRSDFVRTARSKGLGAQSVLFKHALKNVLIPVISLLGVQFGSLIGGSVIIESVFQWPGLGLLALQAVNARDFPLVQGAVIFLSIIIVAINLAVDVAYSLIDPRIRYD